KAAREVIAFVLQAPRQIAGALDDDRVTGGIHAGDPGPCDGTDDRYDRPSTACRGQYIWAMTASSDGERDMEPIYELLGPKAKEITVTLLEEIEARGRAEMLLEQLQMKFASIPADLVRTVRTAD